MTIGGIRRCLVLYERSGDFEGREAADATAARLLASGRYEFVKVAKHGSCAWAVFAL